MTVNSVQARILDLQGVQLDLILAQLVSDCDEKNKLMREANEKISEVCTWFIAELNKEIDKM